MTIWTIIEKPSFRKKGRIYRYFTGFTSNHAMLLGEGKRVKEIVGQYGFVDLLQQRHLWWC
jgi:hypothetical protein